MKAVFVERDEKSAKATAELLRLFQDQFAKATEIFETGIDDAPSYPHYPTSHRRRISSANPLERLDLEIGRRPRTVGIFPHAGACLCLRHDCWSKSEKNGSSMTNFMWPSMSPLQRIRSSAANFSL